MEKLSYGWEPKLMKGDDREVEDEHGDLTILSPDGESVAWLEENNDGVLCLFIAGQDTNPSFSHIPLKVISELQKLEEMPDHPAFGRPGRPS